MTALALALVACCAMVCGTVLTALWLRRSKDVAEAYATARDAQLKAIGIEGAMAVDARAIQNMDHKLSAMRAEMDSLRAQVALRGV